MYAICRSHFRPFMNGQTRLGIGSLWKYPGQSASNTCRVRGCSNWSMNGWCFKCCGLGFQESPISYEKNIPIPKNNMRTSQPTQLEWQILGSPRTKKWNSTINSKGLGILKLSHNGVPNRPNTPLAYARFNIPMNICLLNMDGEKASKRLFFDW